MNWKAYAVWIVLNKMPSTQTSGCVRPFTKRADKVIWAQQYMNIWWSDYCKLMRW